MSDLAAARLGRKGLPGRGNGICTGLEEGGPKDGKVAPSTMGSHWELWARGMAWASFLFQITALPTCGGEVAGGQGRDRRTHEETMALV